MDIRTRPLGSTGMMITTLGFGAWAIGGGGWAYGWGPQEDDASIATIRRAVERGINWIDTAAIYGLGHSEEVVARALREIPEKDRPYVFTKGGLIAEPARPYDSPLRNLQPASIRREVEASLQRLRVERIDLYQIHWPDRTGPAIEDSWDEMVRLVGQGKVRAIGVSNFDVELLARAEALHHVDSIQPAFSLIRRDSGADVIPWAATHGSGVIVYSPMQSGILTDSFSAGRIAAMGADDWRRQSSDFVEPALSRNLALRDALRAIAQRRGTTVAAIAVAWTLAWPGVTGAIVGARTPEQIDGWIDAGRITLTSEEMGEIARAIEATGAGAGPYQPTFGAE